MAKATVRALLQEARQHADYWEHWIVSEFTEDLCRRMDAIGLSRAGFARKIGDSPAYVTKVLRGEENLTAKSMAKLARAVNCVVRIHLAPVGMYGVWINLGEGPSTSFAAGNQTGVAFPGEPGAVVAQVEMRPVTTANALGAGG